MLGLHVNTVHVQFILQYGCCWSGPNFTTACNVHVNMNCTFHFPKFHSAHRSAPSESRISLGQQNENSAAAQPLIGIKRHTPKQFSANLWLWQTCQTSHQRVALRAEGRKTEDQRQEVSVSTCWFRCTPRLEVFFCCFSLVLLAYAREKKTPST